MGMDENKSLKNLLRPIVQYVNDEVEKTEERLKESFPKNTKGEVGAQGERGPKGDIGDPGGPIGPQGKKGDLGATGERGERGFIGEQGPIGNVGDLGARGERGERGFIGEQGPIGEQGTKGLQGFTGDPGASGEKGNSGDKGDRGEIGPRGLLGEQGIQGPLGNRGARGQRGQIGADGLKGDAGDAGLIGPKGERGFQGTQGDKGDPGEAGTTKRLEEDFDALREDVAVQVRQARRSLMGSLADGPGTGAVRVMDQDDVKPGTPADGQILKYDSSEGKFVLSTDDSGSGGASESYVDTRVTALTTANTIQNTELGNLSAQTASLVTANTIQNTDLGNLSAQTASLVTANTIQNTELGNLSAQTASLVTANTIQNVELGNLSAQTATFKTGTGVNLWGNTQGSTPNTFTVPSGMSAHTLDLRQSNLFLIKLENNVEITLSNISDVIGSGFTIIATQDATGGRTWGWHADTTPKYPGGIAPALTTTGTSSDIISLVVSNSTFVYATTGLQYK
jgi:hypothetical protein